MVVQKLQKGIEIVWQCTLLWLVVTNKNIVQQNRSYYFFAQNKSYRTSRSYFTNCFAEYEQRTL